jgi:hypothetical protein
MDGWEAAAADTLVAGSGIEWWVRLSTARASDGVRSLEIYVDNRTDAAKVWIIREFPAEPDRLYRVDVTYNFASRDWGDANLWRLLAGVFVQRPSTGSEVLAGARTDYTTGNGAGADAGYVWMEKAFSFSTRSSLQGGLHVLIGVWGTWETPRTYYLDHVRVALIPL